MKTLGITHLVLVGLSSAAQKEYIKALALLIISGLIMFILTVDAPGIELFGDTMGLGATLILSMVMFICLIMFIERLMKADRI